MQRIKDGALHYWHGTKLLVYETRISAKLLVKVLRGEKLIRREYRQLVRTVGDMLRLVPFIVIVIVPFLEFALPVLLKLFPNMLPSTFEDRLQAEEKMKKQLKIKIEMAKFLQEAAEAMSGTGGRAKDLKTLIDQRHHTGAMLSTEELVAVCRQLGDEITLENLERPQLASICRYMALNAFGTDSFLRFQLRKAMEKLKNDDVMIHQEGVDSLTSNELQAACHARGIRTIGMPQAYLQRELRQWVDLHVVHQVPAPLLILSRAFAMREEIKLDEALRATVQSLPEAVLTEASVQAKDVDGGMAAGPRERLESLTLQEELINRELEQERRAEQLIEEETERKLKAETNIQPTTLRSALPSTASLPLSNQQIDDISEAVTMLATERPAQQERKELANLREEQAELDKETAGKAGLMIGAQVEKLLNEIDLDIGKFEVEIGKRLQRIGTDTDGSISTAQLAVIMRMVRSSPKDSARIARALSAFDQDGDGKVLIRDILELAEEAAAREGHGVLLDPSAQSSSNGKETHP